MLCGVPVLGPRFRTAAIQRSEKAREATRDAQFASPSLVIFSSVKLFAGWWFWNMFYFSISRKKTSQLTFIFFSVETTNRFVSLDHALIKAWIEHFGHEPSVAWHEQKQQPCLVPQMCTHWATCTRVSLQGKPEASEGTGRCEERWNKARHDGT